MVCNTFLMPPLSTDFDNWNDEKKRISNLKYFHHFREGEVWLVSIGVNIGFEINGKGENYARPVLILKKHNQHTFIGLPLSTRIILNRYIVSIGLIGNKVATANLSQVRVLDSKRLIHKLAIMNKEVFVELKRKASQINFD